MQIHEYQAKVLLKKFGVNVAEGELATSPEEAEKAAAHLGGKVAVKAQVHAGGRGKAGGIKLASSPKEASEIAKKMLLSTLVTKQTGPSGKVVRKLYIEKCANIVGGKEYYLGIIVDRSANKFSFIVSSEGGIDIEEVAASHPEKIIIEQIDPSFGFSPCNARKIGFAIGLNSSQVGKLIPFMRGIYNAFINSDASQIEINPMVEVEGGEFLALDAKVQFDDNSLHRHPDLEALRDPDEEVASETEAGKHGLSYIKMDGKIGCMVNGAGLAMATMDIIKYYGSEPANFLDVGGSATRETVSKAFEIILSDKNVKGILVNIFGGIMRCDIIANGIIEAAKNMHVSVPMVVRLSGTNADLGREIIAKSGLNTVPADELADAARKIVDLVNGSK